MNSGNYSYFLNGEPTGVIETFSFEDSDYVESTRYAKPFNTTIEVRTSLKNGRFEICVIDIRKDENYVRAIYEFSENSFLHYRKVNGKSTETENFELLKNAIFFPLMRCFQGQTIIQVAENQDATTVIVPNIQATTKIEDLLKPTFDERTAKQISTKDSLRVFNYLSKNYDENSEFYLDEKGLLVYYKFHQSADKIWTIQLKS